MESEQVNNIFIPCNCVIVHVDSLQRSKLLYKKLFISPGDWRNRTMEHVPLKSHTTMCQHFKPLPDSYSAGVKHRERAELLSGFGSQKKTKTNLMMMGTELRDRERKPPISRFSSVISGHQQTTTVSPQW